MRAGEAAWRAGSADERAQVGLDDLAGEVVGQRVQYLQAFWPLLAHETLRGQMGRLNGVGDEAHLSGSLVSGRMTTATRASPLRTSAVRALKVLCTLSYKALCVARQLHQWELVNYASGY